MVGRGWKTCGDVHKGLREGGNGWGERWEMVVESWERVVEGWESGEEVGRGWEKGGQGL